MKYIQISTNEKWKNVVNRFNEFYQIYQTTSKQLTANIFKFKNYQTQAQIITIINGIFLLFYLLLMTHMEYI